MVCENRNPSTLVQAIRHFANSETAHAYLESVKWPDGPCCPECGCVNVGRIKSRQLFQCRSKGCRKQFSAKVGTVLEDSPLRIDQWLIAVWLIANSRNGISSCELARSLGIKQQSAWHVLHRVRVAMKDESDRKFEGGVESDETFVGGLVSYMPWKRREKVLNNGLPKGKTVVHGILERGGDVRAWVIGAPRGQHVRENLVNNVKPGTRLFTDQALMYRTASVGYRHEWVNHSIDQYVKGEAHTNGLECFFNTLRRGLKGTYIAARPEHLDAYVDEQVFRFNARKETDWTRFDRLMRKVVGKRLTYAELTDGKVR